MARNWESAGVTLTKSPVSRQRGKNRSDTVVIGTASIPTVTDLDKFRATFGDAAALGSINGTSIRVMAQDINRTAIEKGLSQDELEERLWNRLKGIRNSVAMTTTVVKYSLPNGELWTGTDLTEFEQLFAAAMIDMGLDADAALVAASTARTKLESQAK
jgi:hypothetical protein